MDKLRVIQWTTCKVGKLSTRGHPHLARRRACLCTGGRLLNKPA